MNRNYYIATLHSESDGYWVSFVDFPECFTQGETLDETLSMAIEALELCIEDRILNNETIPVPTIPESIHNNSSEKMIIVPYSMKEKMVA